MTFTVVYPNPRGLKAISIFLAAFIQTVPAYAKSPPGASLEVEGYRCFVTKSYNPKDTNGTPIGAPFGPLPPKRSGIACWSTNPACVAARKRLADHLNSVLAVCGLKVPPSERPAICASPTPKMPDECKEGATFGVDPIDALLEDNSK